MGKKKRSFSVPRPWQYFGLALVAIVAGALAWQALQPAPPPAIADRPAWSPEDFEATPQGDRLPKLAIMGDSWSGGTGADPSGSEHGYPGRTADILGWPYKVFGAGGTGYTRGNSNGEGPYADRVDALIAYAPDVVVVQGSSNDYQSAGPAIQTAASDVYARIRTALPDAKIFVLGVFDSPGSKLEQMNVSRAAVSAAAAANGAEWIDGNAAGWLNVATDFADGFHPNNDGHQKVADNIAPILRAWNEARKTADAG